MVPEMGPPKNPQTSAQPLFSYKADLHFVDSFYRFRAPTSQLSRSHPGSSESTTMVSCQWSNTLGLEKHLQQNREKIGPVWKRPKLLLVTLGFSQLVVGSVFTLRLWFPQLVWQYLLRLCLLKKWISLSSADMLKYFWVTWYCASRFLFFEIRVSCF